MVRRMLTAGIALALVGSLFPLVGASAQEADPSDITTTGRETEPVVLTGANFPTWAAPADAAVKANSAEGLQCLGGADGFPDTPVTDDEPCSHNTYEDPDAQTSDVTNELPHKGASVDNLIAYRWSADAGFEQIPFQVDEMFQHYLSNNNSGFAMYSETDQHTSYVFDREGFRWTESDPNNPCVAAPASEVAQDPVPGLDTDDEVVFMARDIGAQAPEDAALPEGIQDSYEVAVADPTTGAAGFVYVAQTTEDGPEAAFDATNGYVRYERDQSDEDPAKDAGTFLYSQSSYGDYGAAAHGAYYDPKTGTCITDDPKQRRPGDQATITTPRYRFRYDGRWLMTELNVSNDAEGDWTYGPDLIDQWKARAFQQRPSGQTPCCGFEEEVNNWGGSSILMGERWGPVRAIRETWGADSGTNVVRREIFYRDEVRFGAFLRVHVIPPLDGIYAQWDYNAGVVSTYYNPFNEDGVAIDGRNDERFGNSDVHLGPDGATYDGNDDFSDGVDDATGQEQQQVANPNRECDMGESYGEYYAAAPAQLKNVLDQAMDGISGGFPEEGCIYNDIDSPDPTFSGVNAGLNWEQVAGANGSLVLRTAIKQYTPGGAAQSLLAVPYYRDDSCFDDGTGSTPGPHLKGRGVDDGETFGFYTNAAGERLPRECWDVDDHGFDHPDLGTDRFYQGAIGTHGVHILAIADSDNAHTTVPITEIDSEQRMVVLPGDPGNVGDSYGRHSEKPLVAVARPEDRQSGPSPSPSASASSSPSAHPSQTATATASPSSEPSPEPTQTASSSPSAPPSQAPSNSPTTQPTSSPTSTSTDTASPQPTQPASEQPKQPDSAPASSRGSEVSFASGSAATARFTDDATFIARLQDDAKPIAGAEVSFDLRGPTGVRTFTATSDQDGLAAITAQIVEAPGSYELTARYAGNERYFGSANSMTFVVQKEETRLKVSRNGRSLIARLFDADDRATGLGNQTIRFREADGLLGSARTNARGKATLRLPRGQVRKLTASFRGDDYYLGTRAR